MKKGDEHMQWYLGKVLQKVSEGRAGGRTVRRLSSVDDCALYMAVIASHFWETAARAPPRLQGVKALQNKTLNPECVNVSPGVVAAKRREDGPEGLNEIVHFNASLGDPLHHLLQLLQLLLELRYIPLERVVFIRFGPERGVDSL